MEDIQIVDLYWQRSGLAITSNMGYTAVIPETAAMESWDSLGLSAKNKEPSFPESALLCGMAGSDYISCSILRIIQLTTVD
ncbi:MAG: hypothetical protein II845_09425 [Oscillospiraceae bacterium]|nr:hypothetical protein [Oscillospiraceae bacterium]